MSDLVNFILGYAILSFFVYSFFFFARAGWSREHDKWNKVIAITEAAIRKVKDEPTTD
jgi:hypothetical protein